MAALVEANALARDQQLRLSRSHWLWLTIVAVVIAVLYRAVLTTLFRQYYEDSTFSHGPLMLVVAGAIFWRKRHALSQAGTRGSWYGAFIVAGALLLLLIGIYAAELFMQRLSLVILLLGLVVLFRGWTAIRITCFAWFVLLLALPLPAIIVSRCTLPLQLFASSFAGTLLTWAGVPVLIDGNVIGLPATTLDVAEACSGLRSLLSLISVAVVYAYFAEKRLFGRAVLVAAAVPIAILGNALRIVQTGVLLSHYDVRVALGIAHLFSGWVVFALSCLLLALMHTAMEHGRRLRINEYS